MRSSFTILLVACLAFQLMAGQTAHWGAIVSGGAGTTVGDVHVVTTMLAGDNDTIETQDNKSASITFPKNVLTLLGKSRLSVREHSAKLLSGGIVVSSSAKYQISSDCLAAVPITDETRYSVIPYQSRIYIDAVQGDVLVTTTVPIPRQMRVPQGKTLAVTNACKPAQRMEFAGANDKWFKVAMGAASSAGVITICSLQTSKKPDMSAEKRICW